jgi:hypothetical protein
MWVRPVNTTTRKKKKVGKRRKVSKSYKQTHHARAHTHTHTTHTHTHILQARGLSKQIPPHKNKVEKNSLVKNNI